MTEILVEAGIGVEGFVEQALRGEHYSRGVRGERLSSMHVLKNSGAHEIIRRRQVKIGHSTECSL